jgi:hypothetical protein
MHAFVSCMYICYALDHSILTQAEFPVRAPDLYIHTYIHACICMYVFHTYIHMCVYIYVSMYV